MGKVQLCHDKRFLNLWINDFPFSSFALMSSSIRCLWHEKSVCDGMSSYDQSIYVQPNPIFVPWTLYLTWSFCLRLLKKLQPCVWRIICVIIIWMKVFSLLIRNTTVARQRFHVFQNDILKSIDNKQCVVLLLLDLSAAFDTVNHKILLYRLQSRFVINKFKSKLKTLLFKRVYELS